MDILMRLLRVSPGMEIWWDSSPLVFGGWKERLLAEAVPEEVDRLREQLDRLIDESCPENQIFRGVTTNPMLSMDVIRSEPDRWRREVRRIAAQNGRHEREPLFWETYKRIVAEGARAFFPLFEKSGGKQGFVSAQVDIRAVDDADAMFEQGRDLASLAPNVMIKVPGSAAGYAAIRRLTAAGIATNNTLTFVLAQLLDCAEAVREGLAEAERNGSDLSRWRSVITLMEGRFGDLSDLRREAADAGVALSDGEVRLAELAIFKKAYGILKQRGCPSKMLSCSLKTGPVVDGHERLWHLEHKAGGDVVVTCPPKFLEKLLRRGFDFEARPIIDDGIPAAVMEKLRRLDSFRTAYDADGVARADYTRLRPFRHTARQHLEATMEFLAFIDDCLTTSSPAAVEG